MHSNRLGGPVWIFLTAVLVTTIALAVFVVVDSIRRLRRCGPDERPWLLFYAVLQGLYLVLLLAAQPSFMPRILGALVTIATPLALIQSIAYLLRVVFPKRPERTPACELGDADADTSGVAPPPPPAPSETTDT